MRLASLPDGTRDGRLVVVSKDLTMCAEAEAIAPTLQHALDHWDDLAPDLEAIGRGLESGSVWSGRFRERAALSPLPRAYQFLGGSAYLSHVRFMCGTNDALPTEEFLSEPMMYQGASDGFLAPRQDLTMAVAAWGLDLEAEIAVIVGDVPQGVGLDQAASAIRLVMLVNDATLRGLQGPERAKGLGFVQAKPLSAFSPVAVTPEALGEMWRDGCLHATMEVDVNDQPLGRLATGRELSFDFPALICHAARTRSLHAGTIISSGTVSNMGQDGDLAVPVGDGGLGYGCLAEARAAEAKTHGAPKTSWLSDGDVCRIDAKDLQGRSVFGAIEQTVVIG